MLTPTGSSWLTILSPLVASGGRALRGRSYGGRGVWHRSRGQALFGTLRVLYVLVAPHTTQDEHASSKRTEANDSTPHRTQTTSREHAGTPISADASHSSLTQPRVSGPPRSGVGNRGSRLAEGDPRSVSFLRTVVAGTLEDGPTRVRRVAFLGGNVITSTVFLLCFLRAMATCGVATCR